MIQEVMVLYLLKGLPVGAIAKETKRSRAAVRGLLKDGGINIRPTSSGYQKGRDSVCEAVRRSGYETFHAFARANSLVPVTQQAELLGTTERAISRVYVAYRALLDGLYATGVALPTTQMGDSIDR
jgi:hypothetical protein